MGSLSNLSALQMLGANAAFECVPSDDGICIVPGTDIAHELEALERSLLDASVRADRAQVAELLADDFVEFGSSGRVWSKTSTIDGLSGEDAANLPLRTVTDLQVKLLAADVALVTYQVTRTPPDTAPVETLRSSIWQRANGKWRMVFHQGTRRGETT